MKSITIFAVSVLFYLQAIAANTTLRDTVPANIKTYSKEQFLKEYGKDETSQKLIRYFFYKTKNAKREAYIYPALAVVATVYGLSVIKPQSNIYGAVIGLYAFLFAKGFIFGFFKSFRKRKDYSAENLVSILIHYHQGNPLPKYLQRQIKYFTRKY